MDSNGGLIFSLLFIWGTVLRFGIWYHDPFLFESKPIIEKVPVLRLVYRSVRQIAGFGHK